MRAPEPMKCLPMKDISTKIKQLLKILPTQNHEAEENCNTTFQTELSILTQALAELKTNSRIRNTKVNIRHEQEQKREEMQ